MPASPLGENPLLFIIFIVSFMIITCLDLEGVLVPEVWIAVAKTTGIEGLALTTRDIPNYDELMRHRLGIIAQHGLTLAQVQEVIAQLEPMPGALDFLDWLRSTTQVVILSDTFEEFAQPLMKKLKMPCILCHQLVLDAKGNIADYQLRIDDPKRRAIKAFQGLNYKCIAAGDSFNDVSMLEQAEQGIFYRPPAVIAAKYPQFPVAQDYTQFKSLLEQAFDRLT